MKKTHVVAGLALASIGIAGAAYVYSKKHPIKSRMIMSDAKNMIKDLK